MHSVEHTSSTSAHNRQYDVVNARMHLPRRLSVGMKKHVADLHVSSICYVLVAFDE